MKIKKFLKQKAVYWGAPTPNGFGGYDYADPIEIPVRWTDKQELFIDYKGESVLSRARLMIDQDVEVKGMFALTTLLELSSSQAPSDNAAYEIRAFQKMPDVRAKTYVRQVWL
jgi:hypothetical protein